MQQLQGRAAARAVPPSTAPAAANAGAGETTAGRETAVTAGKISLHDIHPGVFCFADVCAHTHTHTPRPGCGGLRRGPGAASAVLP